MQLYVNVRPDLPEGGPYANMNPGDGKPFGIIEFGDNAYVSVKTDDEARRVIAAAAALIEMRKMLGTPHEFRRRGAASVVNFSHCARCGMLEDSPDHAGQDADGEAPARVRAEPEPEAKCRACENEPATEGEFCEACAPAALLAASVADGTPVLADDEPEYPAIGSAIPPESNGGQSGYRVGECGHRVAGSEWRAGFRRCEHCGPDLGDDEREYCPECGADEDAGEGHADKCTIGDEAAASVTA